MQDEIRVSRNGQKVAIRNLEHPERPDLKWRCTNGAYMTDEDVESWIPLNRPHYVNLVAVGEYEDAQEIAAFTEKSDADKFVERMNEFAENKAYASGTVMFYPRGSQD